MVLGQKDRNVRWLRRGTDADATPWTQPVSKTNMGQTDRQTDRKDTRPLLYAYHCRRDQRN